MTNEKLQKIADLIDPILKQFSVELFDIEWKKEGSDFILSILIDKEDGADLDDCVSVSELISPLLDEKDIIKQEYILEVASAGAEKPLKTTEQYEKSINKYILVQVNQQVEGYDELVGYLREVNEEMITLEIKIKTRIKNVEIKRDNITFAMTSVKI